MRLKSLFFIMLCFLFFNSNAQDVKPYFQQRVDNKINVTLDDVNHILRGDIEIRYVNHSPDTLQFIFFHIWPNAYSSDRSAYNIQAVENGDTDFYLADRKMDWGGIDSLQFKVNENPVAVLATEEVDVIKIILSEPLLPNQEINITTPFRVVIPKTFSRLGHTGNSYQITQWYPKPAVYDHKGWHPMPYLDQGEFYSEFGDYEVNITLPENYILMASGDLITGSEQLFMDSLAQIKINTETEYSKKFPTSSKKMKTVKYQEKDIHDFAWFADKRWIVKKEKFTIPENGKEVEAIAAFFPWDYSGWKDATEYIKSTTLSYSQKVGPYLYNTVKAVEASMPAGGGMEYPTITIIIPSNNSGMIKKVIEHEVGHNWFYGMLANNERRYPWMDEGINTFYEKKVSDHNDKDSSKNILNDIMESGMGIGYRYFNKTRNSLPTTLSSEEYPGANYGVDIYHRAAKNMEWLEAYMGAENFEQSMKAYFLAYKFKHPYPEDFEKIMRYNSTKNLDWFFHDAMNSTKTVDYKIKKIVNKGPQTIITVQNNFGVLAPAIIEYKLGEETKTITTEPFTNLTSITIDNNKQHITESFISKKMPDAVNRNNYYRKGKSNHLKVSPFLNFGMLPYTYINVFPALGYNHYDGFMLGMGVHNYSIVPSSFQYFFAPMYGFGSKNLVGVGDINYTHYNKGKTINDVVIGLEGKSFGSSKSSLNIDDKIVSRYIKVAPRVKINFTKPYYRSPLNRFLLIKGYYIMEQGIDFTMNPNDSLYRPSLGEYNNKIYGKIQYGHFHNTTFNPFNYVAEGQIGEDFAKLMLTANMRIDYKTNKKSLRVRGFVGKFFDMSNGDFNTSRYYLTSTYTGVNDYLYDQFYFARNENTGFLAKQISTKEGGMKIPTLMYANKLGMSNNWLGAVNITSNLPLGKWPIRIFADVATFTDAKKSNPSGASILYDAGISLHFLEYAHLYIPLLYSKDYKDYLKSVHGDNAFWHSIMFEFRFDLHGMKLTDLMNNF